MAFTRSVSIVTAINILGAVLSIINVMVMAHYFGTSESIEIYFASTILLTTLLGLSNSAQISEIVLPIYHRVAQHQSLGAGQEVYAVILNWAMVISSLLVILCYLILPQLVGVLVPGFSDDATLQVIEAMHWVLPLLFFSIVVQFFSTFVNAESQFGRPELIALAVKLIGLACIILLAEKYDYWALIIGLWLSMLFRMMSYIFILVKLGYSHRFTLTSRFIKLRDVLRQFFSSSGYTFSMQVFEVVLHAGVSQLPQGSFAMYNYVRQFSAKTSGIFLRPVSLVFFTKASKIIAKNGEGLEPLSKQALSLFTLATAPIVFYMFVYSDLFLTVLLGSKGIEQSQIYQGAVILETFFALLIVAGLVNICRKILISSGSVELMYWSTSFFQLISAGIVFLLVPAYGVGGVVLAIITNAIIMLIWLMFLVRKKMGRFYFYGIKNLFLWALLGIVVVPLMSWLQDFSFDIMPIISRIDHVLFLAAHSILFVIILLVFGLLFRVQEICWAFDKTRDLFTRRIAKRQSIE